MWRFVRLQLTPGTVRPKRPAKARALSFSPGGPEIVEQRDKIAGIIEKIVKSDFRAKPGWACAWCEYKSICDFAKKR